MFGNPGEHARGAQAPHSAESRLLDSSEHIDFASGIRPRVLGARSPGDIAAAKFQVNATDMLLLMRWYPRPWLLFLAVVALVPTAVLWAAALSDALGLTHLLNVLPVPGAASSRPERLLLLAIFLAVMLLFPLVAAVSGVLATISFEVQVAKWELTAKLRLPAPPWSKSQLVAVALLALGAVLFAAMAGHLAADCIFGGDCGLV